MPENEPNQRRMTKAVVPAASRTRARLVLASLAMGLLATLLAARIDDALVLIGRTQTPLLEIAADAKSVLVRRRGASSVEIALSQDGVSEDASPSEVVKRASGRTWSNDPLAGMGVTGWAGPVRHQVLFRQGWPLDAFSASLTGQGELEGGVLVGSPRSGRTIAMLPVWSGLLANTLIFASLFWLALSSPAVVRQTLRRRAGLCACCAYSRHGLAKGAPCPECGHQERQVAS